jgi:hypothetical protein
MFQTAQTAGGGIEIDEDGYHAHVLTATAGGFPELVGRTADGYDAPADLGGIPVAEDANFYTTLADEFLGIDAMFLATTADGPERPMILLNAGLYDLDDPAAGDFPLDSLATASVFSMRIITKPEDYGVPNRRKRGRIARVVAEVLRGPDPVTVTLYHRADDLPRQPHQLTLRPGQRRTLEARVGGRGHVHDLDIRTNGRIRVIATSLAAELLEEPA